MLSVHAFQVSFVHRDTYLLVWFAYIHTFLIYFIQETERTPAFEKEVCHKTAKICPIQHVQCSKCWLPWQQQGVNIGGFSVEFVA